MAKSSHKKTSLFIRIIIRLCLPLIFLGIVFSAIQIANQVNILNELQRLKSLLALDTVSATLEKELQHSKILNDSPAIQKNLNPLEKAYKIHTLQVYDFLNRKVVINASSSAWSKKDLLASEKSLRKNVQNNEKYHVTVDRESKKLNAYIPLRKAGANVIYIAKVSFALTNIQDALKTSRSTFIAIIIFVILTGIFISNSLARSIVRPIADLHRATQDLMSGKLGKHVHIKTGDEIEALAKTFNHMSDNLKEMKNSAQDANPLTGLPGNNGIFQAITEKIQAHQKFVFFHADIDRFKLFNDHFGLAAGDKAITATAEVLKKALKEKGKTGDFIGHQGGDDYVVIAHPDHAQELGDYICELFDKEVRGSLYPKEDLENGYTMQVDRRKMIETGEDALCEYPLMSISLAGISNKDKDIPDYFHCMNAGVAAKKAAKEMIESCCLIQNYALPKN